MSTWPCALAPARRGSPIYSASPLRRAVFHTPVAPAGALNDIFPADSVFAQLQGARQPRYPRQSRSNGEASRSCNVRLMLRPARSACPALVRTFTSELSQAGSPPDPASDITSWLIVCYHGRIFPGRTGSLMGCNGGKALSGSHESLARCSHPPQRAPRRLRAAVSPACERSPVGGRELPLA